MGWEAWMTLGLIGLLAVAMVRNLGGPDTILLAGLSLLMGLGMFSDMFPTPAVALASFGNEALVTIGVLFVVAEGLTQTGAMTLVTQPLLGRPKSTLGAQGRLLFPVAALSAFLNNTPIVAMFIPVVNDWCRKLGFSPSKLFIPLSYAAIMGGACTLIGTATNLVVYGMVNEALEAGQLVDVPINMFTVTKVGLPAAIVGIIYLMLFSNKLLPDRRTDLQQGEQDARQYSVEMLVAANSPIDGKTIEQAGLRNLPGAYLMEIDRNGETIVAVGPEQILRGNDRLIFVGVVDSVVDLQKIRGLAPASDQVFKLDEPRPNRRLVEAVVSDQSPLLRRTIREGRFRTRYNAVVIAVHRGGKHLTKKIGDIILHPGDTLLLETHPQWTSIHRNSPDFFLVSEVEDSQPIRYDKARLALIFLVAMVASVTLTPLFMDRPIKLVTAALLAGGLMVVTGCCSPNAARSAIRWRVLLTMGAALGIGKALETTGAADHIANTLLAIFEPFGPRAVLASIYLLVMGFTSLIGPIGTVAMIFPIAKAAAISQGYNFMPFAIILMMTAVASFATPTGYQTNLMVYGAGRYKFSDYVRIGLPLNFIMMAIGITLAPIFWPIT
jgi:di/tricarboxylate transporter